jgi:hypothetical protein
MPLTREQVEQAIEEGKVRLHLKTMPGYSSKDVSASEIRQIVLNGIAAVANPKAKIAFAEIISSADENSEKALTK